MKKFNIITVLILLFSANLFAQYSTDWIRPADNYLKTGVMIARDISDNVIVTGYIQSQNIYTRKYDKFGNFLWERTSTSGIHSNYEKPIWVNTDNNNNVFVVGYRYVYSSSRDRPNAIVVLKYNASGTLLWKKNINMNIFVNSMVSFNLRSEVDNNGNLYIGTVAVSPSGFVLIKLNPNGTTLFTKSNNLNSVNSFRSMRLKGNIVVLSGASASFGVTPVISWNTSGALLWTASVLGQSGNDVEIDGSGNSYILTSYPNQVSATSGQDILIHKLNLTGGQIWQKNFDFGGYDFPTRFTLVSDKLSVIGYGSTSASYFDWITFQINTSGTKLWGTRYNATTRNDEQPYFLAAKANGEVYVTGKGGPMFTQANGSSYLRMITLKYSNTGATQWVDSVNIYSGWGLACTLASDNSLFVLSGTNMTAFHFLDQSGTAPCTIPVGLNVTNVANTSATFSWTPVTGATLYHLRYKTISATTWTITSTSNPAITLTGLSAGTSYNYAVEAVC
ncbi:MAG: fibronectin type III domain-containing protein, partial [Flavisolibacter sp.]